MILYLAYVSDMDMEKSCYHVIFEFENEEDMYYFNIQSKDIVNTIGCRNGNLLDILTKTLK